MIHCRPSAIEGTLACCESAAQRKEAVGGEADEQEVNSFEREEAENKEERKANIVQREKKGRKNNQELSDERNVVNGTDRKTQ